MIVTAGLIVIALIALLGLVILIRQAGARPSFPLPLAALPLATLLLIGPVSLVSIQAVINFRNVGLTGRAGFGTVAAVAIAMVRPLWFGCFGFLLGLGAAVVREWFEIRDDAVSAAAPARSWPIWTAGLAALVVLPASGLVYFANGTAERLMLGIVALSPSEFQQAPGMDVNRFAGVMSARLMLGTVGGLMMLAVGLGAAFATILAHRAGDQSPVLKRISGIAVSIGALLGIWLLVMLTMELRSIAHAAAAQ